MKEAPLKPMGRGTFKQSACMFVGSTDEDLQFGKISRVQFQLSKVGAGVALLDKSMNGTYVNSLKVGKDKQHSLDHGDVISILQLDFQVYLFLS